MPVVAGLGQLGHHRWARVLAAVLTTATALFLSYVATFILFVTTPFRPSGPYGEWTCLQPHLLFGQICRDWTEHGMTSLTRLGWGLVFLGGFVLLTLLARRLVWVLLFVPLATIPYFNTERRTWIVLTIVSVAVVVVAGTLRLYARGGALSQTRFVPIGLLTVGVACATFFSILHSGPPIPSLRFVPGLVRWAPLYAEGITCDPSSCLVLGNGASHPDVVTLEGSEWGAITPIRVAPSLEYVACSSTGNCIADEQGSGIALEVHGVWHAAEPQLSKGQGLLQPTAACSPHGICWVTFQRYVPTGRNSQYDVSFAAGELNGHWLPVQPVGPKLTPEDKAHGAMVFVSTVTCWSPSSCTLSGSVVSDSKTPFAPFRPFVQSESNGVWGPPTWIPRGLAANSKDYFETFPLVQLPLVCTSGDCLLGGSEWQGDTQIGAAVEREDDGKWQRTTIGTGDLLGGRYSWVTEAACHTAAHCVVAGGGNSRGNGWLFFRAEVDGTWRKSLIVPTKGSYDLIGSAHPTGAACPTSSSCYVVGWWQTSAAYGNNAAFVARYANARWHFGIYALGLGETSTELLGLGCDDRACWAIGDAFYSGGRIVGFAYPLVHLAR